ncbi:MAG: hypothetical protein R3F59_06995 [Myxococcota bacterium]
MNPTKFLVLAPLLAPVTAAAADTTDGSLAVLLGTDSAFDGNPATLRLTLLGQGTLVDGEIAALDAAIPLTWMTSGEQTFGVSTHNSVVEIPPSLRLELLPKLPVRPYGDLGLGVAVSTTRYDGWLFGAADRTAGWMTRSAVGVELGPPDGVMFIVEPLSAQTYHLGDEHYARLSGMIGVGSHF